MLNAIEVLERIGKDSRLRHARSEELLTTEALSIVSSDVRAAIVAADKGRLETLLGAVPNTFCGQHVPDDAEWDESGNPVIQKPQSN